MRDDLHLSDLQNISGISCEERERRFTSGQEIVDGDGESVQEALNLLVSWVGFSAVAPEGTALGLPSPLPCVDKTPPLLPLGSVIAIVRSNSCRWEMMRILHILYFAELLQQYNCMKILSRNK